MSKKNQRLGGSFDDFLKEEGLFEKVSAEAAKKAFALKLEQQMAKHSLNRSTLAGRLGTSRAVVYRVLDAKNTSVTLHTLSKTAAAVGLELKLELVPARSNLRYKFKVGSGVKLVIRQRTPAKRALATP